MARTGKDKNQSPGRTPDPKGRKILGRKLMQNEKNAEKEETVAPPAREDRESSPGKSSSQVFTKFSSIFTNYFFVELRSFLNYNRGISTLTKYQSERNIFHVLHISSNEYVGAFYNFCYKIGLLFTFHKDILLAFFCLVWPQ